MSADYLIKVKVQNNKIVSLMRQRGIDSAAALAAAAKISYSFVRDVVNMTISPLNSNARLNELWNPLTLKLADFFNVLPEEMFNTQQLYDPLEKNYSEKEVDKEQLAILMAPSQLEELPYEEAERCDTNKALYEALQTLTPREQAVIKARFGLEEAEKTLAEVAAIFNVCPMRIRQIECKALRKMRAPSRTNKIRGIGAEKIQLFDNTFGLSENQRNLLLNAKDEWREIAMKHNINNKAASKFLSYIDEMHKKLDAEAKAKAALQNVFISQPRTVREVMFSNYPVTFESILRKNNGQIQ